MERWKPVVGYEELYEVSSLGRVRRVPGAHGISTGRVLKSFPNRKGYYGLGLYKGKIRIQYMVHILVAVAFRGPPAPGYEVNHEDGVKSNNELTNLRYRTRSYNLKHAFRLGLSIPRGAKGEKNASAKLTWDNVREIRSLSNLTQQDIADRYGLTQGHVSAILRKAVWKE